MPGELLHEQVRGACITLSRVGVKVECAPLISHSWQGWSCKLHAARQPQVVICVCNSNNTDRYGHESWYGRRREQGAGACSPELHVCCRLGIMSHALGGDTGYTGCYTAALMSCTYKCAWLMVQARLVCVDCAWIQAT